MGNSSSTLVADVVWKYQLKDIVTLFVKPTASLYLDFTDTDNKYIGESGIIVGIDTEKGYDVRFLDGKSLLLPENVLVLCFTDKIKTELEEAYALWGKNMILRVNKNCVKSLIFVKLNEDYLRKYYWLTWIKQHCSKADLIGHLVVKEGTQVSVVFGGPDAEIITAEKGAFKDVPSEKVENDWMELSCKRLAVMRDYMSK